MPETIHPQFGIFPFIDDETRRWSCELTVAETGKTITVTEPRRTRRGAVSDAQKLIKELLADKERAAALGVAA